MVEEEDFVGPGKLGRLFLQPVPRLSRNAPRPRGESVHGIETEKDRIRAFIAEQYSVRRSEEPAVSAHSEPGHQPLPYRGDADFPVSRNTNEWYTQRHEEISSPPKLEDSSPVRYVAGDHYKVRTVGNDVFCQGLELCPRYVAAEVEI